MLALSIAGAGLSEIVVTSKIGCASRISMDAFISVGAGGFTSSGGQAVDVSPKQTTSSRCRIAS